MGEIMQLSGKKLDERQRLVRDQAHRTAYKIIAVLCLGILVYFGIHSMLVAAVPPYPVTTTIHTVKNIIVVSQNSDFSIYYAVPPKQPAVIQWIASTTQSIDLFGLGIYYGLFFLTVVLIVTTLPKAIIAWKERG